MRTPDCVVGLGLVAWLAVGLLSPAQPADAPLVRAAVDVITLRDAGLTPDGPGVQAYLRKLTPNAQEQAEIRDLAAKLASPDPAVHSRAATELVKRGQAARPALRALTTPAARSLRDAVLTQLDRSGSREVAAAAVRVLAEARPPEAAATLLAWLPYAPGDDIHAEILQALGQLADDPAVLAALKDADPARRATAVAALASRHPNVPWSALRERLSDADPGVRLAAARALAQRYDPAAVPILIDLVAHASEEQAEAADAILERLVSSGGPVLTSSERSARAQAWKSWWDGLNSAAGRQFFRERTPSDEARSAVALLIADLADGSFRVREQATRSLPRYGSLAAAALEPLAEQGTPEEARRARQILTTIERSRDPAAVTAVLRRFVLRPPDNAVRLLLDYLPVADGEDVVTEVHAALAALAWRAAETPPELLAATTAREPVLRAAAAFALASRPDQQERVRALLADPNPLVRWRASEGLLRQGQREAVPVAIELIGKLPQAAEAERLVDLLRRLAGENAPETDQRSAWLAWWERTGERLELAPLGDLPRPIGVTQVVLMDPKQGTGRFVELGPDGRERARIEGLGYPVALAPAESGRVLIAEQQAGRVTERDRDGSIVWKAAVAQPLACERLPGGRTFVAGRQMLLEFDRRGEPVLSIRRPTPDIIGAARSRDGTFVIITSERRCLALDRTGKLLRSFPVGKVQPFCQIDLLPGGRVLVPEASHQRVTEYDASGQVVWQTSARQPVGAVRLAGGRTLIAGQAGGTVTEVDRSGKIVWQHEPGGLVWAACRR